MLHTSHIYMVSRLHAYGCVPSNYNYVKNVFHMHRICTVFRLYVCENVSVNYDYLITVHHICHICRVSLLYVPVCVSSNYVYVKTVLHTCGICMVFHLYVCCECVTVDHYSLTCGLQKCYKCQASPQRGTSKHCDMHFVNQTCRL